MTDLSQADGLTLLQAMIDRKIPRPSMADTMNMALIEVSPGRAVFEATATGVHLNPMGGVHGGFAAAVLDSSTGCAIHTVLPAGVSYGTIDLNVKMLRPLQPGQRVISEAKVITQTRSLAVSSGTLVDETGRVLAQGTATCMLIHPKA